MIEPAAVVWINFGSMLLLLWCSCPADAAEAAGLLPLAESRKFVNIVTKISGMR